MYVFSAAGQMSQTTGPGVDSVVTCGKTVVVGLMVGVMVKTGTAVGTPQPTRKIRISKQESGFIFLSSEAIKNNQ
jgi:hypothetical protein